MLHKGKLLVFLGSALVAMYGISGAFYGKVVATDEAYPALSVFMDALNKVNDDYVESPDMNRVQEGAMRGLIEALDAYSCFLTKEQLKEIERRSQEGAAGTGIMLSKRGDIIYVVSVRQGSPAEEAGIRPGDYVTAIDGQGAEDKSILEAESLLSGAEGSAVKITIFRSSRTQPLDIPLVRKALVSAAVETRMLDGRAGLLDVSSLRQPAVEQARLKLKTLISAGAEKLILDLRDCADGQADDGAELANFFLKSGVLYLSKDRAGQVIRQAEASLDNFVTELPTVVLINASTAGAAEVAAGALKDHRRAKIVGEKSFGSGSEQKRIALKSGAVLILSTARLYTPDGKMIQEENTRTTGIKPDVQSPDSDRRQDLLVETYYEDKDDAAKYIQLRAKINKEQLDRALEVLAAKDEPVKRIA